MSGYCGKLEMGKPVYHNGKKKVVKDWHFISWPGHNNDRIVILFTDGSNTDEEGFSKIKYVDELTQ